MCGIIGVASNRPVVDKLITGLARQEYRGYDSAGLAVFNEDNNSGRCDYDESYGDDTSSVTAVLQEHAAHQSFCQSTFYVASTKNLVHHS